MIARNIGFNRVETRWLDDRRASGYRLFRSQENGPKELIAETQDNVHVDTVPDALSRRRYPCQLLGW